MYSFMVKMELESLFENIIKPIFAMLPKSVNSSVFYRFTQVVYIISLFASTVELYGTIFFIVLNLSCLYFWLGVEINVFDSEDGKKKHKSK